MIFELLILVSICTLSINGAWCRYCWRPDCDPVSSSCPPYNVVPDICNCCKACAAGLGEVCTAHPPKRCADYLRCSVSFGCRYKNYLPWAIILNGTCVPEYPEEDYPPAYCYDRRHILYRGTG